MTDNSGHDFWKLPDMPPEVAKKLASMSDEEIQLMKDVSDFSVNLAFRHLELVRGKATQEELAKVNELADQISRLMYLDSIEPPKTRPQRRAIEKRLKRAGIL